MGQGDTELSSRRRGIQTLEADISEKRSSRVGKVGGKLGTRMTCPLRRVCTASIDRRRERRIYLHCRMVPSLMFAPSGSRAGNHAVPAFPLEFSAPSRGHDSLCISLLSQYTTIGVVFLESTTVAWCTTLQLASPPVLAGPVLLGAMTGSIKTGLHLAMRRALPPRVLLSSLLRGRV